jgi:CDP-paratose 2-epimerase
VRVLVTGGAGFVGASVALALAERQPDWELIAFDNLRRRGSELNLPRLREAGVRFEHGDVRSRDDVFEVGRVDAIVECSAEPSVQAGLSGSPAYVVETNLLGAYNCFELARRDGAFVVFLSTSRVYPIDALRSLALRETESRFELEEEQELPGASAAGISESFPLAGARSFYGTSKLAAELLLAEYDAAFGVRGIVDRFGVIAGPWQMGKVDQGVFTHWVASHLFGWPLRYLGYGGSGKQVRDLLHVEDVVDLIEQQVLDPDTWTGFVGNVGGGVACSLSLREATDICRELTGNEVELEAVEEESPADVPVYLSDCSHLFERTAWRPRRGAAEVLADIHRWLLDGGAAVRRAFS